MRRTISASTTVAAATLLAVITVFLPSLPRLTAPVILSLVVILFAIAWPATVSARPRWGVSAAVAVPGLSAIWIIAVLPLDARFSGRAMDLWLAPVGGAAAFGVLLIFVIQTFSMSAGIRRALTTAMLSVGAVISAASAGWALLLRNKYEVALGAYGAERISGVTWLMLTVLAALAVSALVTLLPTRRRNRMMLTIVLATAVAVALQFVRPGPLSVPAVIASALTALMVALLDSLSESREAPSGALNHPLTAVAVGSTAAIAPGILSYFVIHALPW